MAVERGKRKAINKFYKMGRPLITSGEKAGQRDTERITARIQVVPEAMDQYHEKKLNGFTLEEIEAVRKTGNPVYVRNQEGVVTAKIEVGTDLDQWTVEELDEVIAAVKADGGPVLDESPLDRYDLERLGLQNAQRPQQIIVQMPQAEEQEKRKPGRPRKDAVGDAASGSEASD